MSDLKAFRKWFKKSGYGEMERMHDIYNYEPQDLMFKAYIQGCVDLRVWITERLKDNLKPSVYDTVIRIIHAA